MPKRKWVEYTPTTLAECYNLSVKLNRERYEKCLLEELEYELAMLRKEKYGL